MSENHFYKGAGETVTLPVVHAGSGDVHNIKMPTDPGCELAASVADGRLPRSGPIPTKTVANHLSKILILRRSLFARAMVQWFAVVKVFDGTNWAGLVVAGL
jgi:hypothetical protein